MEASVLILRVFFTQPYGLGEGLIWYIKVFIQLYEMPVPKHTSCYFGGSEYKHLLVTSANENMTDKELKQNSLLGMVFIVELFIVGFPVNSFNFEPDVSC